MQDLTQIIAIDNAGPNADGSYNVVSPGYCRRITLQEDYDSASSPTADLRAKMPASAANFVKVAKGTSVVYTPVGREFFKELEVVGTIKTSSGSINAQQVASMLI